MFINFATKNFRSIKERVDFSMCKHGQNREISQNYFHPGCFASTKDLLKSAVIYGANASGKSNLIRAVSAMQFVVRNKGVTHLDTKFLLEPFKLDKNSLHEPIFFEMELVAKGKRFRYGFECTHEKIVSEWLYGQKKRMILLFARQNNQFVKASLEFAELNAWTRIINDTKLTLPENTLFLSTAAQMFSGGDCEAVQKWFENNLVIFPTDGIHLFMPYTLQSLENKFFAERITSLLNKADFGIQNLTAKIDKQDNGKQFSANVATNHIIDGISYPLDMFFNESEGTQKVFALSAPLIDILSRGKVLFIDELDAKLHPLLVSHLLELFHEENTQNAQIIAAVHTPSILTETFFRRDQVWFANKHKDGSSTFNSLAEFTGIRKNFAGIVKDYLHGCFGGVPYINDLSMKK